MRERSSSGGMQKSCRSSITPGLISTVVRSVSGKCLWMYLCSAPPPNPIINTDRGAGLNSKKPIIARV
jgi:hypothetical protein